MDVRAYVWRLRPYSITETPAYCYEEASPNSFLFNPLGIDTPLFTRPQPTTGIPGRALNLPTPIPRRSLQPIVPTTTERVRSFQIWQGKPLQPVPPEQIVPADLTDWTYRPLPGQVAVDPELGRIAFPPTASRKQGVWVSYHYAFSADMGGGEYRARRCRNPAAPSCIASATAKRSHASAMPSRNGRRTNRRRQPSS